MQTWESCIKAEPMDKDDEYRKQAAEAQAWADRTISATDRAAWLRVAQGWLALIRKPKAD